jgi:choice-of-anchor C domain-containing protein
MAKFAPAIVLALVIPVAAHANLISDGDFNSPSGGGSFVTYGGGSLIGPWTVTGASVDLIGGYWQAPTTGGGSVDLDGNAPGGLTQNIKTVAGQTYDLSFYLSGNPDGYPNTKTLNVSAGTASPTLTYTIGANTHSNMLYVPESIVFIATAASTQIAFTSGDVGSPYGPVIGGVSVIAVSPAGGITSAVPEPMTVAILGFGLAGIGLLRQRRR